MKILIIGAGGVGGYFGGMIAKAGYDTRFIARGEHLQAIQGKGLQIHSLLGDFCVYPKAANDFKDVAQADLILLCVKSWQIEEIALQLKPLINNSVTVLPLQNGADNAKRLKKILPESNVIAGLCRIVSKIESPGVISHFGFEPEIVFGETDNSMSQRLAKIKTVFDKAGFKNRMSDQIQRDIWLKFLFIATISGLGALTRSVLGRMRDDAYIKEKLIKSAQEIVELAVKMGIELNQNDIERTFVLIDKIDHDTTMSMQRDIMQGKPSELENLNGFIVKEGERLGIDTPVNSFVYHSLLPMELKARGF